VTLCCFGWRKRRSLQMLLLITVSIAGLSLINGCSFACPSCSKSPTTPVTLTLSVVATSGSASHTTNFSYVVIMPD
jgi:CHASE2 domain-containing sensor protein